MKTIKTPCIGVCSTGIGDDVCRGCKRFSNEVINWNSYTDGERDNVMRRLQSLLAQVVNSKVHIFNGAKLKAELHCQQIRFDEAANPETWLFTLLKAGANQINNLETFGCRAHTEWDKCSFAELRDAIDADFYTLSCAHFQRYFMFDHE